MPARLLESKHTEIPSAQSKVCRLCSVALWKNPNDDQQCHVDNWGRHLGKAPRFRLTEHRIVQPAEPRAGCASPARDAAGLEGTASGSPVD
jgi:hypothetical protein